MGRKKKKVLLTDIDCQICGDGSGSIQRNSTVNGLIYQIAGEERGICRTCGEKLIQVIDIMRSRWG